MAAGDNKWVRMRAFEVEEALNAAYEQGRRTGIQQSGGTWGNKLNAYEEGAAAMRREGELEKRKAAFDANIKALNSAGQAIQANANALEAVARLVDNMGRL